MERITTPTRQLNKWGDGKDGFTDGNPDAAVSSTQLDAGWHDHVQEEIANTIELAGMALDPNDMTQLWQAISAIAASGNPDLTAYVLKSGDTMTGPLDITAVGDFGSTGTSALTINAAGGSEAVLAFHRGSAAMAMKIGLDGENRLAIGGWSWPAGCFLFDSAGNLQTLGHITSADGNLYARGSVNMNYPAVTDFNLYAGANLLGQRGRNLQFFRATDIDLVRAFLWNEGPGIDRYQWATGFSPTITGMSLDNAGTLRVVNFAQGDTPRTMDRAQTAATYQSGMIDFDRIRVWHDGEDRRYRFGWQGLHAIAPELAPIDEHAGPDDAKYYVDPLGILAVTVAELQALRARVAALEAGR